jgi:hypothetical protein
MTTNEHLSAPMIQNPYAGDLGALQERAHAQARPAGITVTSVLSIVAGLMGGMFSLLTIVNLIFSKQFMATSASGAGENAAQQEMLTQMQALGDKYLVFNGLIGLATLALAIVLLAGGTGLLMNKRWSRLLLRRTFLAAIILEVVAGGLYMVTQLEMMPIMDKYMGSISSGEGASDVVAASFMRIFTFIGMGLWLVWALGKCAMFFWGRRYLNKPTVVSFFEAANP